MSYVVLVSLSNRVKVLGPMPLKLYRGYVVIPCRVFLSDKLWQRAQ